MDLSPHASASELVAAMRGKQVSSRELVDQYVERITASDLNAVVCLDAERAMALALAADERLVHGAPAGPLDGLPITIKDTIETEGLTTTAGDPGLADHVPDHDAVAVRRLKAAGAIVFGKTNAPLYGGDGQSYNEVYGTTLNPWDTTRTPGGSSGGSAAAVAAGQTGLELGSDIGGSVRIPAHYCGIFAHKPSQGLIPTRGHIPPSPGALSPVDMAVVGPMGRSAEDLDMAVGVLAGPDDVMSTAWGSELPPPRRGALKEYRVAVWMSDDACAIDAQVAEVLARSVDALAGAGAKLTEVQPDIELAEAHRTYQKLLYSVTAAGFSDSLFDRLVETAEELDEAADDRKARYFRYGTERHRDWLAANEQRASYQAMLRSFFGRYDVLLCPTSPTTAIPHDHSNINDRTILVNGEVRDYWDQIIWTGLASMSYLPATVMPVGVASDGLPVGLQVVGPFLEDRTPLDFAQRATRELGGFQPPPA